MGSWDTTPKSTPHPQRHKLGVHPCQQNGQLRLVYSDCYQRSKSCNHRQHTTALSVQNYCTVSRVQTFSSKLHQFTDKWTYKVDINISLDNL